MFYSDDLVEEIRTKNDIIDVISGYVKLQKKGSSHFGLCPFHNEKSPSFSVSQSKQIYHCFGCGAGGNVYTFIMEYENYSFPEALKNLAERVGVELPEAVYSEEAKKQADLKSTILDLNKEAAKYFYYLLRTKAGEKAYTYLINRELSEETIKKFGLGYANKYSDDLYKYFKKKGHADEILRQSGLVSVDEKHGMYDKFWNRVIFPIMDVNNRVIGFGGRVMGEGSPKYLNSPETKVFDKSKNLYGLNIARASRKNFILVCEGYMDVISLHQAGFHSAVASLGTSLTSGQASLLKRYTKEVMLTYDSDGAGVKAALRAIPILKSAGLSVRIIDMRPYKDPDEFIKALGADEYQLRIDNATNSFMYEIQVLQNEFDMKDPESKTAFYNEIAKKLLDFTEEIERNNYLEAVAAKYKIGFDNLRKLVNHMALKRGGIREREKPKSGISSGRVKEDGMLKSQKLLLTWLIEDEKIFDLIKPYITEEDFTEALYRTVASMLFEQHRSGSINPAKIINHFMNAEEQRDVAALFNATLQIETEQEKEKALHDTIFRIKQNSINYKSANTDITDIHQIQQTIMDKNQLEKLKKLQISLR